MEGEGGSDEESDYGSDDDDDRPLGRREKRGGEREKGRCKERLVEYWEVEGRMLCERHMRVAVEEDRSGMSDVASSSGGSGLGVGRRRGGLDVDETKAMKRVTRFIDLQGLGGMGLR